MKLNGVAFGISSGVSTGLYTAFMALGTLTGVQLLFSEMTAESFAAVVLFGALSSALVDFGSLVFAFNGLTFAGKWKHLTGVLRRKGSWKIVLSQVFGTTIANTSFVLAITLAGPIAIPITVLFPVISSILDIVVFKTKVKSMKMIVCGHIVCTASAIALGVSAFEVSFSAMTLIGLLFAVLTAVGWAIDGTFVSRLLEKEDLVVASGMRYLSAVFIDFFVLLPVLFFVSGIDAVQVFSMQAVDVSSLYFLIAGMFALLCVIGWYKANKILGVSAGTVLDSTYAFFGPLFTMLLLSSFGIGGYEMTLIQWIAAAVMFAGVSLVGKGQGAEENGN